MPRIQDYWRPTGCGWFKEDLFKVASDGNYNNDDSIRYTCFIDEYTMEMRMVNYDTQKGLPLKDFINTKPRTIQISTIQKE